MTNINELGAIGKNWGEMFLPDGIVGRIERTISEDGKITEKYIFLIIGIVSIFLKKVE